MIGMSFEVFQHHIRQHPCDGSTPVDRLICPHDVVTIYVCGGCEEPVFVRVNHGEHCPDVDDVVPWLVGGGGPC